MENNKERYLQIANDAIEFVFESEYNHSLGIPMPLTQLLLADDPRYKTGEYYITINETWQIHLKFGKLPISYQDFYDEVKVLTRHEIGHYMCCPYNPITQFRMIKCILNVYHNEFKHLHLNIDRLCWDISNQFADIVVDTRNYYLNPNETAKSETNWIKKCGGIKNAPLYSKLMFLSKELLWKEDLDIKEEDTDFINCIKSLVSKLQEDGIENRALFLPKLEAYSRQFFQLIIKDQQQSSQQSGQQQSGQQGNQQSGQQQSGQQGNQQSGQLDSTQNGNTNLTPKDGDENGNAIIFIDPDKIKDAIEQLASETDLEEFVQILNIAGINQLSEKDKEKLWFSVQTSDMIVIEEYSNNGSKDNYTYPTTWKIGEPIGDIDMMLSFSTAPKIIPGITTKKWEMSSNSYIGVEKVSRDLLLVVDTSGSMGAATNVSSNMHQAVLASYGIIEYFIQNNSKVALLEFNDRVKACVEWTKDYEMIRNQLLTNGSGGTNFPINRIKSVLENKTEDIVTVLITDGDLGNVNETVSFFETFLYDDNKLYIFLLGNSKSLISYEPLKNIGAKVYNANNAKDFCNMVLDDLI